MENKKDILKQLANYEVKPPEFLTRKVWESFVRNQETNQHIEAKLGLLKDHEVKPPENLFISIINGLGKRKGGKLINIGKPFWWAAAAITIATGIWVIYNQIQKTESSTLNLVQENRSSPTPPNTVIPSTKTNSSAGKRLSFFPGTSKSVIRGELMTKETQEDIITDIILDGTTYQVKNLDYFVYFTNLKEDEIPPFIKGKQPGKVMLYLDESTSISVSPAMVKMMRKLYSTKPNGTPTRRAQRIKRKMTKWKLADEIYFDKNLDKNPMNPVDLGNFLLD